MSPTRLVSSKKGRWCSFDLEFPRVFLTNSPYVRHVDDARPRVRGCLALTLTCIAYPLRRHVDQPRRLLHVLHRHRARQPHLRQRLAQPNHALQLPRRGRHHVRHRRLRTLRPHLQLLLAQLHRRLIADHRLHVLPRVGNVLLLLTSSHHAHRQRLLVDGCGLHHRLGVLCVQRDQMRRQCAVRLLRWLVQY